MKFGINLKLMYRFNFWLGSFSDIIYYSVHLLAFFAIFSNVESINGWNSYQMMFFLGTFFLIDSLAMVTFFIGVIRMPKKVRSGELDIYLTKPVNPLFLVSLHRFEISFAPNILYGLALISIAWANLDLEITFGRLVGYIALTILMLGLNYTIMVAVNCLSFWFMKIDSINTLRDEMFNFSYRIPGVVYRGFWKLMFMVLVPYGLIATIPTQFATAELGMELSLIAICVSAAFWVICLSAWKAGLKHYDSSSS